MTCEEYIIKRLERAEDDARNIRDAYELLTKRIQIMEEQLIKVANCFEMNESKEVGMKYIHAKEICFWDDGKQKEIFDIIRTWMDDNQDQENLPFEVSDA